MATANLLANFSNFAATNNSTLVSDAVAPVLASAVTQADGLTTVLSFTEVDSPPLLPASSITGFSMTVDGTNRSIAVARTGNTEITLTHTKVFAGGAVRVSYSGGNVTDSASNALGDFTDFAVTNNGTTPYAALWLGFGF